MANERYWESIKRNFERIDALLSALPYNGLRYKLLFGLRTYCCVNEQVRHHKGEHTFSYKIRTIVKLLIWLLCYPFIYYKTTGQSKCTILGNWRFDDSLSAELHYPIVSLQRSFQMPRLCDFIAGWRVLFALCCLLFSRNITLWCCGEGFRFWRIYSDVDLHSIQVIITEDDISPNAVAILMRAKELGIKRVKIEYVQIDSVVHNNVFCDYYFYPTTYHRRIRENTHWNKALIYVQGGYLNTDYLKYKSLNCPEVMPGYVTFYTAHSDLFEYDDLFYIEQILALLPPKLTLCIKIHPYDKQDKYDHFANKQNVKILKFGTIDNAELIAQSSICLSQFSVMSLEAKQNCNHSYFFNYAWQKSQFTQDYAYLNEFFDTIDSPDMLRSVLQGEYKPVTLEKFRQNVNMTFPHTFEIFQNVIDKLSNNISLDQVEEQDSQRANL